MDLGDKTGGREPHILARKKLKTLNGEELKGVLQAHAEWVSSSKQRGRRADLVGCKLQLADLQGRELSGSVFRSSNLTGALLDGARLGGGDLRETALTNAHLRECNLRNARLAWATLRGADLTGALLLGADLSHADLRDAALSGAWLGDTKLSATNLSGCRGLEHCAHESPSPIDFRTIERSGSLPPAFLLGCGVPSAVVASLPGMLSDRLAFPSCFVVYGTDDGDAARRLCQQLRDVGVRAWPINGDREGGPRAHELDSLGNSVVLVLLSEATAELDWLEPLAAWGRRTARDRGEHKILFFVDHGRSLWDDARRLRDAKDAGLALDEPSYLREEKYLILWDPTDTRDSMQGLVNTICRFRKGQVDKLDSRYLLSRKHWL
jgi:uncharacterized protein YjbI with pentapeptide repeats